MYTLYLHWAQPTNLVEKCSDANLNLECLHPCECKRDRRSMNKENRLNLNQQICLWRKWNPSSTKVRTCMEILQ